MISKILFLAVGLIIGIVSPIFSQTRKFVPGKEYATSIILKDGTIIDGYISHENLSSDSIEITGYTTTISVPSSYISLENRKEVSVGNVDDEIGFWLENNPVPGRKYIGVALVRPKSTVKKRSEFFVINLESPIFNDGNKTDETTQDVPVIIAERGDVVKYVDLNTHVYNLTWKDIDRIVYPVSGYDIAAFYDEIVDIDGQELSGEIMENVMRNHRKILLDNGMIQTIKGGNIFSIGKRSSDNHMSLLETAPLLAVLELENGEKTEDGVIVEDNKKSGHIKFLDINDEEDVYTYDEVASIRYKQNPRRITSIHHTSRHPGPMNKSLE